MFVEPVNFKRDSTQKLQNIFLCSKDFMKVAVIIKIIKIVK